MNFQASRAIPAPGFNYTNCKRNADLISSGYKPPQLHSTGTTIVAVRYMYGVIMGADTRITSGTIVAEKNACKIYPIGSNIYACASGNAGDAEQLCNVSSAQVQLLELNTNRKVPVVAVTTQLKHVLYKAHGALETGFVLGGVDYSGPAIYSVFPYGSSDKLPYVTMGSGAMPAMGILELRWRPNISKISALELVRDAIKIGIRNDLSSGGDVDICIITRHGAEHLRHFIENPLACRILVKNRPLLSILLKLSKKKMKKYKINTEVIRIC